ncbi:MAG: TrkA family potassium uptake protein [Ruminococcaceae bacterium]|nr:TrkA family potassium uptake protein [Oscillospiraceae bacterium]
MSIYKTYAVFGLGRYGFAVAKELSSSGAEVLAVDISQEIVDDAINEIPLCKCADVTDPDVIRQLGVSNIDVVIVAMAGSLEASVMAVTLCKEAGVETVIAKCASEMHRKILSKVGADIAVLPESESGTRLAKNILSSGFMDVIELSKDVSMVELEVRNEWTGKNLLQLDLRKKYSLNVVAIRQNGEVSIDFDPQKPLEKNMKLVVIANTEKLNKLK